MAFAIANDKDVSNFEKGKLPEFWKLVKSLEANYFDDTNKLSEWKDNNFSDFCDLTHTGYTQSLRRQTQGHIESNYPAEEILKVIYFCNFFGILASLAICDISKKPDIAKKISELGSTFIK